MDYPHKGTNLPENFTSMGYQKPKIISAENKMNLSTGDKNRLERSMKKSTDIKKFDVPLRDDVFREKGQTDQIVENFGVENYKFIEEGIPNNNEYKVHNNPTDREFNINEVNGSGYNYKEGQFPNKIDSFEMGYNYRGGLKEIRGVKFPEGNKEKIIIKNDEIDAEKFIQTGGMKTTEKNKSKKEKEDEKNKKKEKVVKPPEYDINDYDGKSSNVPDSNKDKIVENTESRLGVNLNRNVNVNVDNDEENDDDKQSSNLPDSNKDRIIEHTASILNRRIDDNKNRNIETEIMETNRENIEESNVVTTSEKIELTIIEKNGKRTVIILKNGEEISEDELPEEYRNQLEEMKKKLDEEQENIENVENVDNNQNENVGEDLDKQLPTEEYKDENEGNNLPTEEKNNENVELLDDNAENKDENGENQYQTEENNVENVENQDENGENQLPTEEKNVENVENQDENGENQLPTEEKKDENVEIQNENVENKDENVENYVENEEIQNENVENVENIENNVENVENKDENKNVENYVENEEIQNENVENEIVKNEEGEINDENKNNQYVIETVTETKTNENGEVTEEKRVIVKKNGVEISEEEIPEDLKDKLKLIQAQIDEGKAHVETIEDKKKIENTNTEIVSKINKDGNEEITETVTKEVKEIEDGKVVNEEKTVTTTKKRRRKKGELEEGLESDTDKEYFSGDEYNEPEEGEEQNQ